MEYRDSKYQDLNKTLNAIGKAVFVNYYYDFKDPSIHVDKLSKKLAETNPNSHSQRQGFRIPRARHIFANNQQCEALKIIIDSPKVDISAREKAVIILQKELLEQEAYQKDIIDEKDLIHEIDQYFQYQIHDLQTQEPRGVQASVIYKYKRKRQAALNALSIANYSCEIDPTHKTFLRKNGACNYTEPHHLIPLSAYRDFPNTDLDCEQNIVSLCSHCHNLIHYGADSYSLLKILYDKRINLLNSIGINISFEDLKKYY